MINASKENHFTPVVSLCKVKSCEVFVRNGLSLFDYPHFFVISVGFSVTAVTKYSRMDQLKLVGNILLKI